MQKEMSLQKYLAALQTHKNLVNDRSHPLDQTAINHLSSQAETYLFLNTARTALENLKSEADAKAKNNLFAALGAVAVGATIITTSLFMLPMLAPATLAVLTVSSAATSLTSLHFKNKWSQTTQTAKICDGAMRDLNRIESDISATLLLLRLMADKFPKMAQGFKDAHAQGLLERVKKPAQKITLQSPFKKISSRRFFE
jgi:hypothetical protein